VTDVKIKYWFTCVSRLGPVKHEWTWVRLLIHCYLWHSTLVSYYIKNMFLTRSVHWDHTYNIVYVAENKSLKYVKPVFSLIHWVLRVALSLPLRLSYCVKQKASDLLHNYMAVIATPIYLWLCVTKVIYSGLAFHTLYIFVCHAKHLFSLFCYFFSRYQL